ncbi:MAG: hypothetical protein DWQ36_09080 [Acidobacteria bacterium]|nr:MAG: hypothetical protein DWQ30_22325 [Acidobacteriota bacterium]REK08512.1 MAG: hypothetical protein DWQ36_09080 [Acidobacteriota bacterium]
MNRDTLPPHEDDSRRPLRRDCASLSSRRLWVPLLAAGLLASSAMLTAAPWEPVDLTRDERVGSHVLSHDGSMAAWVKTEVVAKEGKQQRVGDLYLVRFASAERSDKGHLEPLRLTRTQGSYGALAFSPDGRHLAFSSDREAPGETKDDEAKGAQVWVLPLGGGEARRVTSFDTAVSMFAWIDDDRLLVARRASPPRRLAIGEEGGDEARAIEDVRERPAVRLFRVDVKDGEAHPLGRNQDWIDEMAVSPDGKTAVISAQQSLSFDFDAKVPPRTFLVDLGSGERREILQEAKDSKGATLLPTRFRWAPDSGSLFFLDPFSNHPIYRNASVSRLHRHDLASGETRRIDAQWERGFSSNYEVVPAPGGGARIVALLENGVSYRPAILQLGAGDEPPALRDMVWQREADPMGIVVSRDGSRLLYEASTANHPPQLYSAVLGAMSPQDEVQLGALNPSFEKKPTGRTEVVQWVGAEGDLVEGLLHYPLDWKDGESAPAPLVLDIHGGPSSVDRDRWDSNWGSPNILWRQRGAFVFQVNYHGSSGYGLDWVESIEQRYYELELPDIESGVDALIDQKLVDPERLAATGWSNGGILSAALITDTRRYKAAIVGAADVEWISDWGNVSFGASFDNYYFGGPPWERLEHYIEKSPYFELGKVTTPTLIHTGDADTNVPPSQSWSMFRALQQLGNTEVRFVLYPGEPHGLRSVAHQERKIREDLAWLDRHLFGKAERTDFFEHDPALPRDSALAALFELQQVQRRGDGALGRQQDGVLVPETTDFGELEIARFELTRAQLAAMTGDDVATGDANLPAMLSYEQAREYATWLSERTGSTYRLPTAAEAKKFSRKGGNTLQRWLGYEPTVDDLAAVEEALDERLRERHHLLVPVDRETAHRGRDDQALVWGLGGNVATWAVGEDGSGGPVGPAADRAPGLKGASDTTLVGLRLVREGPAS